MFARIIRQQSRTVQFPGHIPAITTRPIQFYTGLEFIFSTTWRQYQNDQVFTSCRRRVLSRPSCEHSIYREVTIGRASFLPFDLFRL